MKFGKKVLSFIITLAMVIALLPGMSFEAMAEELNQEEQKAAADYILCLAVEEGEGKAYKNSSYGANAIDLPEGLSYADGVWTMDGFEFQTTANIGVYFAGSGEIKLKLAPGSVNKITADYHGSSSIYGLYVSESLTVSGTGSLDITAGISSTSDPSAYYAYGVYSGNVIELNGGNLNVRADNAYCAKGIFAYGNITVNGGTTDVSIGEKVLYESYAVQCYEDFRMNGGGLNAAGGTTGDSCGICAYTMYFPINGTVHATGTYKNLYFYRMEGEVPAKSGKSEYMNFSGLYEAEFAAAYGLESAINVQGYYNNNWIKTTYADQGYNLSKSNLGSASVTSDAEFVYGGHYVLLSYTVEAEEAISDGRIGIWTDVMIGDNDRAPIYIIKDSETGKVTGYELVDDHTGSCSNLNAKYMIYFDGYMISSAIDEADFVPADRYWFGYWSSASDNVFNQISAANASGSHVIEEGEVTGLQGIDSGMALSWPVNLEAGESQTYYALLGIGDATFKERPKFKEETIPTVTGDGKVTAVIENKIENKEDAGNLTLSVITTEGKEYTVGDAPLELLTEQEAAPYLMTATFTDRLINARPGSYAVKTVRATNKGGMFTDYTFADEAVPSTEVVLIPRDGGLDLSDTPEDFESLLYEGWEWSRENSKLYFFGMQETGEEGIRLPADAAAIVEEEGVQITVTGENQAAISSSGSLTIKSKNSAAGELKINAPVAISGSGDVTIQSRLELNASETAIRVGENGSLKIEEGASLVINLTDENAVMFKTGENEGVRVSIPEGYKVEGGTIDDNSFLVLDAGVTKLKIVPIGEVPEVPEEPEEETEVLVTLDYNGHGSVDVATMSVAKKSTIERPADPQAFGYSFQGWVTEAGKAWNFLTETVTEKMTLFATWKKDETSEKTVGDKTIRTGVATLQTATELVPESEKEKEIVDELIANGAASTVPTTLRAALSRETYEALAEEMSDGSKLIMGLRVDLVGCEAVEETTTQTSVKLSFDVHPWCQIWMEGEEDEGEKRPISNDELNGKVITFRLPLTSIAKDYKYIKLTHYLEAGGEDLMYLDVCSYTEDGKTEYFVNVNATQFSIFEMVFTNEKDEEEHISSRDDDDSEKNWWSFTDTGWILHNGNWYNIQNNHLVKGWFHEEEDDQWYYLDPDTGIMKTGWLRLHDNWFFLNDSNKKQTWYKGEDGKYHFGGDDSEVPFGALLTGCTTPDGYEVDETGMLIEFEEL